MIKQAFSCRFADFYTQKVDTQTVAGHGKDRPWTDKQTNKQIPRTSPRKVSSIARSLKTKTRNQNVKM